MAGLSSPAFRTAERPVLNLEAALDDCGTALQQAPVAPDWYDRWKQVRRPRVPMTLYTEIKFW